MSQTTALAQQQRDVLNAIFDNFAINNIAIKTTNTSATAIFNTKNRGIKVYQANATASALRSMQTAYPVIAQLIGDEAFEHLARDFWSNHPPTRGDLAQWGGELSGFIASISALQTEPYLSDVARAEWQLHSAATAADAVADLATFSLLTEHDPDALTLQLAPGTALIHSDDPIASILTAHLYAAPSFEDVGQKLRQNSPETALVWRRGLQPRVTACTTNEAALVASLLTGKSLLAALEAANLRGEAAFDFHIWLQTAVGLGLVLGAQLLN